MQADPAVGTDHLELIERLTLFAAPHDRRGNVVAHMFGVPLMVLAAAILLGLLRLHVVHLVLTAADAGWLALAIFWVRLDARLGAVTAAAALPVLLIGNHLASRGWFDGLLAALSFAVLGLACELGGHALEGSRPAVLIDRMAAAVAPLFLVATAAFALGLREDLAEEIDRRVRALLTHPARFEPLANL